MEEKAQRWRRTTGFLAAIAIAAAACGPAAGSASPVAPTDAGTSPAPSVGGGSGEPSASAGGQIGGTVSVIGSWGGSEQDSFQAMVAPFEAATGVDVQYTGTRDLTTVLSTGVASGILPDVGGLPTLGSLIDWTELGALKPLDDVLDLAAYKADTAPALVELGTIDGKISGVFIKAAVKGLIWYNPKVYTGGEPASWDALTATAAAPATDLWCIGLESGAASGWASRESSRARCS